MVQLNHSTATSCKSLALFTRGFIEVDVTGQHQVRIAYCECKTHEARNGRVDQIFCQHWIPAMWNTPWTAFTFKLLNSFRILNLQSKSNLFDFYQTICCQTNNGNLDHLPVHVVKIWSNIHL
jgi:hypothetical protein